MILMILYHLVHNMEAKAWTETVVNSIRLWNSVAATEVQVEAGRKEHYSPWQPPRLNEWNSIC